MNYVYTRINVEAKDYRAPLLTVTLNYIYIYIYIYLKLHEYTVSQRELKDIVQCEGLCSTIVVYNGYSTVNIQFK